MLVRLPKLLSLGPFKNAKFVVGVVMLLSICAFALVGSSFLSFDPLRMGRFRPDSLPSSKHPLGTDSLGRDVLGQLLLSILNSLQIGIIVATLGTSLGATVGFMAGYRGGLLDNILRSIVDVFLVVPMLPILILVASLVRIVDLWLMSLILSVFAWAWPARQMRAQALSLRERDFVYTARLSGMGETEIVFRELMPNMLQYLGASFFYSVLWAMLSEVGLELLGLGPQRTTTLGMMLFWAMFHAAVFRGLWWWWCFPVFSLIFIFASLFLLHLGLDEIANPRLRKGA